MNTERLPLAARRAGDRRQQGVVMIITLIALIVLLISGVALVRSFDTSLLFAGNLAIKRDLMNQGERAMSRVVSTMSDGGVLGTETARDVDSPANNYSSVGLATDNRGVPLALLDNSAFTMTGADVTDSDAGVTIRYIIDRQCNATGPFDPTTCVTVAPEDVGGTDFEDRAGGERRPVYRVSIRVQGPRRTEAYLQSTVVR